MDFTVSLLLSSGARVEQRELPLLAKCAPGELQPVREPRAYKGQRNVPGYFWMSKLNRLVWYESRLEMVILKQIDFDPLLIDVLPQPFVLHYRDAKGSASHTPDYLAWYRDGSRRVFNVKPAKFVHKPNNQRAFAACAEACRAINWQYSTQAEPPPQYFANLSWLAGYRRRPPHFETYASAIIEGIGAGTTIGSLLPDLGPPALVRPVLFYLMWVRQIDIDMHSVLSDESSVRLAG